jgi:hypothetical protein
VIKRGGKESFSVDNFIPSVLLWLAHHPFGAATMVYVASIVGVLLYAYFEPRDRVNRAPF